MCEVEYTYGEKSAFSTNLIAENMSVHIDEKGNCHVLMYKITDYLFDEVTVRIAAKSQAAFMTTSSGTKHSRKKTQGVIMCIKWLDRSTTWVVLKDIKEAYPVQLAEYAVAAKIYMEPVFAWWVPHTLKKRNLIIVKLKSKYWLKTQKFGIKVPNNMKQEIELDRNNGNILWLDVVCQEMKNVCPTFEPWEKPEGDVPSGY